MPSSSQRNELISAYLADTLSASALADAMGWPATGTVCDILSAMHSEYHASPCDTEGATPDQLAMHDRIIARAVARIEGILAR